jgi:hypothetical protein
MDEMAITAGTMFPGTIVPKPAWSSQSQSLKFRLGTRLEVAFGRTSRPCSGIKRFKMSDSDYASGWELKKAKDQAWGQRLLQAVQAEIKDCAEEAADLAREKQDENVDSFGSLWDAICYQVVRGTPEELANYEKSIRALCNETLDNVDGFTQKLFAMCTTRYDEFDLNAYRGQKPSLYEWASDAIYACVLKDARADAKSGFLSYDPDELKRLRDCLRALIPLAKKGRDLVGIGQAIEAVETLNEGRRTDRNLDVGCGFRAGDSSFEEGLFATIYIRENRVGLDTMSTAYNRDVGSDHESKEFSFPSQFDDWCEIFRQIINRDDAKLSVSFNSE